MSNNRIVIWDRVRAFYPVENATVSESIKMKSNLICTLGTSLSSNLNSLGKLLPTQERGNNLTPILDGLRDAFDAKDWDLISQWLTQLPPTHRSCGAEINSIENMVENGLFIRGGRICFLSSDTPISHDIAIVLEKYFRLRGFEVEVIIVPDMQDDDPQRFQSSGVKNFCMRLAEWICRHGQQHCIVNATGGYKAQIAGAVLIANRFDVPVYYMHERFGKAIQLPTSAEIDLWLTNC